jgi:hypothetical protein
MDINFKDKKYPNFLLLIPVIVAATAAAIKTILEKSALMNITDNLLINVTVVFLISVLTAVFIGLVAGFFAIKYHKQKEEEKNS